MHITKMNLKNYEYQVTEPKVSSSKVGIPNTGW